MRRVLIYVQHLLGIGHLRRAATIARAAAKRGLRVTLVSGGWAVPGTDWGGAAFVQLPPVSAADVTFKTLLDADGQGIDDAWRARRCAALLAAYAAARPEVLLIETFPFGRRQLRFELLPLLEAAHAGRPRPLVLASVRDVLVGQDREGRAAETVAYLERYFDRVLVHGDPAVLPLDVSCPFAHRFAHRTTYTGYVVEHEPRAAPTAGRAGVLVSAGGGAVGARLLATALAARALGPLKSEPWRILVGANAGAEALAALRAQAPPGVSVEAARPDFPDLLVGARLAISQGGYNTVLETVAAGTPAVVVPFAQGAETEQTVRALHFAAHGLLAWVAEEGLTPAALAAAIDRALTLRPRVRLDLGGADGSAQILAEFRA
ncbi:MAG: glycosyl transferase family 28 [Alphaproteobacteria bacterium]|nr:glycosyl transferase family 28 [Alphaproteobacteria bacterium]